MESDRKVSQVCLCSIFITSVFGTDYSRFLGSTMSNLTEIFQYLNSHSNLTLSDMILIYWKAVKPISSLEEAVIATEYAWMNVARALKSPKKQSQNAYSGKKNSFCR